jgi:hypothetical protein
MKEVNKFQIKFLEAETRSLTFKLQILNLNGFAMLLGKITSYAINLIASEWTAACTLKLDSV